VRWYHTRYHLQSSGWVVCSRLYQSAGEEEAAAVARAAVTVTEMMAIDNLYGLVAGRVVCIAIDAEGKHSVDVE